MKIIHTSDWHWGQHFYRFDREEEHQYFIRQLGEILKSERPDVLVVSGDVFDSAVPSANMQKQFVDAVLALHEACPGTEIVMTAGNHDSGSRLEVMKRLWTSFGVHVFGTCRRREDGTFDPAQYVVKVGDCGYVIAAPYFHVTNYPLPAPEVNGKERQPYFFQALLDEAERQNTGQKPVVLMAHLAVEGCIMPEHDNSLIGMMETSPLEELGQGYDYLALGHIHRPHTICGEKHIVRYSGSPIPLSFNEHYEHSVTVVEMMRHGEQPQIRTIPIEPLRKVKTLPEQGASFEEALCVLKKLKDDDNAYVRLLVDEEGTLPADAEYRACEAVKDKKCRFCEIKKVIRKKDKSAGDKFQHIGVEEMKKVSPIEIADHYFEEHNGHKMDDRLKELMEKAIVEATQDLH